MAITWRNINVPNQGSANALFDSGADRISQGIGQLTNLAAQYGSDLQAKEDEVTADNTENMLLKINQLSSMDEYNQALQSGEFSLDKLQNSNVDVTKIQNALMQRDNTIMDEETTAYNYEQAVQTRADLPVMQDFQKQLIGATTVEGLDTIMANLTDSGLSEEAQLKVTQAANQQKQSILDNQYQTTLRNRENTRWGWQVQDQYDKEKQKFVDEYRGDEVIKINNTAKNAEALIASADASFPVQEGFEDQLGLGTSIDALRAHINKMDTENVDVTQVFGDIQKEFSDKTFKKIDENGQVVGELTFDNLPYWVVDQAMQSILIDEPNWYNLADWGKGDLSSTHEATLQRELQGALDKYGVYDYNLKQRNQVKSDANSVLYGEQLKLYNLRQEAAKEYDKGNRRHKL